MYALTAALLVVLMAGCSFLLGEDGIPSSDYNDALNEPTVLFLWEQDDGLSSWTLDGNGQGVGSVEIDESGRLSFQVDLHALPGVRTPSHDLGNSAVDIRVYLTNGSVGSTTPNTARERLTNSHGDDLYYNIGSGWVRFAFNAIDIEPNKDCTVEIVGGGYMDVVAQPSVTCLYKGRRS
jgi:hypothetical protein